MYLYMWCVREELREFLLIKINQNYLRKWRIQNGRFHVKVFTQSKYSPIWIYNICECLFCLHCRYGVDTYDGMSLFCYGILTPAPVIIS